MATINLTTADNDLTVLYNGTTIKKIYYRTQAQASAGQAGTQVYQKWKDSTTITKYESINSFISRGRMINTHVYVRGKNSQSYNIYSYEIKCMKASTGVTGYYASQANAALVINGSTFNVTGYLYDLTSTEEISTTDNYSTVYAYSDFEYKSKRYQYYSFVRTSDGETSSGQGPGNMVYRNTGSVETCPDHPGSTYPSPKYGTYSNSSNYKAYYGATTSIRVQDN